MFGRLTLRWQKKFKWGKENRDIFSLSWLLKEGHVGG
jgi:hypothetical protein